MPLEHYRVCGVDAPYYTHFNQKKIDLYITHVIYNDLNTAIGQVEDAL